MEQDFYTECPDAWGPMPFIPGDAEPMDTGEQARSPETFFKTIKAELL